MLVLHIYHQFFFYFGGGFKLGHIFGTHFPKSFWHLFEPSSFFSKPSPSWLFRGLFAGLFRHFRCSHLPFPFTLIRPYVFRLSCEIYSSRISSPLVLRLPKQTKIKGETFEPLSSCPFLLFSRGNKPKFPGRGWGVLFFRVKLLYSLPLFRGRQDYENSNSPCGTSSLRSTRKSEVSTTPPRVCVDLNFFLAPKVLETPENS